MARHQLALAADSYKKANDEGSDVEGKLKKLLARAREAQKETVTTTVQAPLPGSGN